MAKLIKTFAELRRIFEGYAAREGNKETLTKDEVKTFLEKELFEEGVNQEMVDYVMRSADFSGDNELDFVEFMKFVSPLAIILSESCPKE